jgi:hypothetical protein
MGKNASSILGSICRNATNSISITRTENFRLRRIVLALQVFSYEIRFPYNVDFIANICYNTANEKWILRGENSDNKAF